jgi:hypothetical protein
MTTSTHKAVIQVESPVAPPYWALLERELIRTQSDAIDEYFDHYFDERGYLLCVPRWGGDDGPDDAAENLLNWTMLAALGAPERVFQLYRRGWEGHLRQYTEARTVEVSFGRDGMYYKEFPVCFDWFHHGEGLSAFFLEGLVDPADRKLIQRTGRFAGFYMDEDPQAPNYDPEHRVIRSMFNGSRGPLLRKATALDWAGDPIEVEGRFQPLHAERSYAEMLEHFRDYNDVVGDHPLNLGAGTLGFNAFVLTGEKKYRDWLLGYVDAWIERTAANDGILPTNVGLDGAIGGACGGRWWGGVYGWGFSVYVTPFTGELAHRNYLGSRTLSGFANALLLTGDQKYVTFWRDMIERVNAQAIVVDGQSRYPHMRGDQGWYEYRPHKFAPAALELYYWTLDRDALALLPSKPRWIAYLDGQDAAFPVEALQADLLSLRARVDEMRRDPTTPDTRLSDDPNHLNPATTETLTQLMLGGLPTGRDGYPLHCRLRYFDPVRRRAGIPDDVAALIEKITADEVVVNLVNTNPSHSRDLIVQGGAYAEHQILDVRQGDVTVPIDQSNVAVRLAPAAGSQLRVRMKRYANEPTLAFPWV